MEELILLMQKTYGLAGLLIIAPFVALYFLFRQNLRLHHDISVANEKTNEVQKQRVQDAQSVNEKLMEIIKEQSALNTETNIALDRIGDALSEIQQQILAAREPTSPGRRRPSGGG